jgi:carboxymethylenebutenolidase
MCHSDESRPPAPPRRGPVGDSGPLTLTAPDGNRFAAYRARPAQPTRVGMVILPDVRGLHPFYVDLAHRFAEAGFDSIAFDYFGRTAGEQRDESVDWQQHIEQVTPDHVRLDAGAAVETLRSEDARAVFTVGFCFGGGHSWRLSASDLSLDGTIGFYGRPARVTDVIDDISSPLLMLVAGADQATPLEEFHALDAALTAAAKEHEMYVYDGAPHSFFDRGFADWRDACADAWARIIAFTDKHSA